MFDLPEHTKARAGGPGWLTEGSDLNPDGTVNLAWPATWEGGKPSLVSRYLGYEGFAYNPKDDYLFISQRFKLRHLPEERAHPEK